MQADRQQAGAMPDPPPDAFIARILGPDRRPVGVGALVTERHILTCAHVVNAALGLDTREQGQPTETVELDFPLVRQAYPASPATARAVVECWLPPPRDGAAGDDIAGLALVDQHAPRGTSAARFAVEPPRPGRTVLVFGYPAGRPDGAWSKAAVRGPVGGGRLQLDSDSALRVQHGFSGAPVFDDGIGRVVGMIASAPRGADERDSYAIDVDRLRLAWPEVLARHWPPGRGPASGNRDELTILHISDTRFGRDGPTPPDRSGDAWFSLLHRDLEDLADEHGLRPDLLVVTGDLAEQGRPSEFKQAAEFLGGLAEAARIPRRHVAIVPGNHDVNRRACEAYFAEQESNEAEAVPPYWPKWRQFASVFQDFYVGLDSVMFTPDEPWSLFEMPELAVVVAGVNSTMAESHRESDHYGWVGERQLRWFADRLSRYRTRGWLRVIAVHHSVVPGAAMGEENLRDTDDLDRLIGQPALANLLLHGHAHNAERHVLQSGLPVLATGSAAVDAPDGPAELGHYQLITVRRDGFIRYVRQYATAQRRWISDPRVSRTGSEWHDTWRHQLADIDGVFRPRTASAADPAAGSSGDRRPADGGLASPREDLLDRVAEATSVRFPGAIITKRPEAGYLRVSHPLPGGGAEEQPVGVIDGPATEAALDTFVEQVHARFAAADPLVRSELVYGGPSASSSLAAKALRRGVRLRSLIEYQGLLDLRPLAEAQRERLATDRIYPARLYIPQRYRVVSGGGDDIQAGLIERVVHWLGADDARLVVVLGDFGRGKTSFLRQLARTLPAELPGTLPILVELRGLEKAPALDELLTQYLVRQGVEDVNPAKLRYMIHSGRVGLLFDGYDELELRVGYDNATDYLQVLLESVTGRAKVVMTSRTQHFRSTEQVKTALGERVSTLAASQVVVLEDFSEEQIIRFLTNLFGDEARARARFDLLGDIGNLLDLAHNPRMLAFIAEMDESRLRAVQDQEQLISVAGLYREIIDFWLTAETERQQHRRGRPSLGKDERLSACTALARRLWAAKDDTIALSDLSAEVSARLTGLVERGYSDEQASHSIGSGSLLVRTDDGAFAFVHQSIMEWLVAADAARDLADPRAAQILASRRMSRLMADFFSDLAGYPAARDWAAGTLADPQAPQVAKQNALAVMNRTGQAPHPDSARSQPERQNLAGIDLRDQDLTGRDLRGADLHGANLSGMWLHDTDLSGADLREADLSGARLVGGSLQGAILTGSRWARAALFGTDVSGDLAMSPELQPAAMPGRDAAEVMIQAAGPPSSVAFSPDGTLLAAGTQDAVQLIDVAEARTIRILPVPGGDVLGVAFSPDGTLLAAASDDGTARVWDPVTGTVSVIVQGHTGRVLGVAISPDSAMLATASSDRTARIWNLSTRLEVASLTGHADRVRSVAFSPDGTMLATASDDGTARIWDLVTADFDPPVRAILHGRGGGVSDVAFSPDSTLLATALADGTARIWDLATDIIRTTLQGHTGRVLSVAFSPDGALVATGAAEDGTARIWDLATGTERTTLRGRAASVLSVAFSSDGLLATASDDGATRIWEPAAGSSPAIRATLYGRATEVNGVALSPDGTVLITTSVYGTGRVWDLATGTTRAIFNDRGFGAKGVAFSPDGTRVATAAGSVQIWKLTWSTHLATGTISPTVLPGHGGRVFGVTFSPDGTLLATTNDDGSIRIWDLAAGSIPATRVMVRADGDFERGVMFSPDGTLLATISGGGKVRVWEAAGRGGIRRVRWRDHPMITLPDHAGVVVSAAFSPDGTRLAVADDRGFVQVWDLTARRSLRAGAVSSRHGHSVLAAVFSPDGAQLMTVSADGTLQTWDLTASSQTEIRSTRLEHSGSLVGASFCWERALLATVTADGIARIWDLHTGAGVVTLAEFPAGGSAVVFDGGYKLDGDPGHDLWWAMKLCRFAPGELDPYAPGLQRLPAETPLPFWSAGPYRKT